MCARLGGKSGLKCNPSEKQINKKNIILFVLAARVLKRGHSHSATGAGNLGQVKSFFFFSIRKNTDVKKVKSRCLCSDVRFAAWLQ